MSGSVWCTPTPGPSPQGGGGLGRRQHLPLAGRSARVSVPGGGIRLCKNILSAFLLVITLALAVPAFAVQPDEMLSDPVLEARARAISAELRCLVCQNQSIDDSDADLARDLRILVRERLLAGDTDQQAIDYIVARYGEFVLLRPTFSARNALLWGAPLLILMAGGAYLLMQGRRTASAPARPLSPDEAEKVAELLRKSE